MDRFTTILATGEVVLGGRIKLLQPVGWKAFVVAVLDDLVGVHDDRDEQGEHHVDEQTDEEVEVDTAVDPDRQGPFHGDRVESGKHVVAVDQTEQTLTGAHQGGELEVVRAKDHPSSKGKADV